MATEKGDFGGLRLEDARSIRKRETNIGCNVQCGSEVNITTLDLLQYRFKYNNNNIIIIIISILIRIYK